eukprot:744258_1
MNRMTVAHVYYGFSEFECDTAEPQYGEWEGDSRQFQSLLRCAVLCNNAKVTASGEISGDASETALVKFALAQLDNNIEGLRDDFPQVHGIPFNSGNKWQVSIHKNPKGKHTKNLLVLKGAPEKVLGYCDTFVDASGAEADLTSAKRDEIRAGVMALGRKGERVLGFCQLELDGEEFPENYEFSGESREKANFPFGRDGERGITFIGLFAMIDPPRPGVPQAVAKCQTAG